MDQLNTAGGEGDLYKSVYVTKETWFNYRKHKVLGVYASLGLFLFFKTKKKEPEFTFFRHFKSIITPLCFPFLKDFFTSI